LHLSPHNTNYQNYHRDLARWLLDPNYFDNCVASATSGQKVSPEMRDFNLLQATCRGNEVHEQTRVSKIYGGAEA
jgi:hypothetical protein